MQPSFTKTIVLGLLIQMLAAGAFAASTPQNSLNLTRMKGQTFFELTADPKNGIKKHFEDEIVRNFVIADKKTVHAAIPFFAPEVYKKIIGLFAEGETGLVKLVDAITGRTVNAGNIAGVIRAELNKQKSLKDSNKMGLAPLIIAPFISEASGAGITVHINADNYYYNYGYKAGSDVPEELAAAVKSGRSFGAGPMHKALDASDVYYLNELEAMLTKSKDVPQFYNTILQVLANCDTSGYAKLSPGSQTVATDFLAIYTAELDRHLMSDLAQHPWENDLAETTFLSVYGTQVGMVEKDGKLQPGTPKDYFGVGRTGSGIGNTRKDRRALQRALSQVERKLNPEAVAELEKLIGTAKDGDVIHQFMMFLNDFDTQKNVKASAPQLVAAFSKFLGLIQKDAKKITQILLSTQK